MTRDAIRLALGTLTVLLTRPPRSVNRDVGGRAMMLAPAVGGVLAVAGGLLLWLLGWGSPGSLLGVLFGGNGPHAPASLAAVLVVALLATLTRAIHLDGLADTADGLGSGKPTAEALEVMRRGDVGPFGVVTLVLVLVSQVLALATLTVQGFGVGGLAVALVVSRLALPVACRRGVPAARPDGLGYLVAGTVGPGRLVASVGLAVVTVGVLWSVSPGPGSLSIGLLVRAAVASVVALGAGAVLVHRAVRRLGGVTGDVLGAGVEVTFTAVLVVLTLAM